MFTWYQWIAVIALMWISVAFGFRVGKKAGGSLTNYYRDLWLRRVDPNDPRFRVK